MSTQNFKQTIEQAAKRIGIDLIGFASKKRFESIDAQHNPFSIFPEGKTVIMVSSEMPELLGVCDRILVMSGGRVAGEVDARNTTQEEIMTLAAKYV